MGLAETTTKTVVSAKPRNNVIIVCSCHSLLLLPVSSGHLMWPETTIFIVVSGHSAQTMPVCAPETTRKTVVSGKPSRRIFWSEEPKKWVFCAKISRFAEAHRDLSQRSRFPSLMRRVSETPIFIVFSGLHEARSSKNALFRKPLKTRDREENAFFERFGAFSGVPKPLFL